MIICKKQYNKYMLQNAEWDLEILSRLGSQKQIRQSRELVKYLRDKVIEHDKNNTSNTPCLYIPKKSTGYVRS